MQRPLFQRWAQACEVYAGERRLRLPVLPNENQRACKQQGRKDSGPIGADLHPSILRIKQGRAGGTLPRVPISPDGRR
jgi:hypothetical protein